MTVNKRIHEDSDFNNAEKAAENILHWVIGNRNKVIAYVAIIVLIIAGFSSFSYVKEQKLTTAQTNFGTLFVEQQAKGSFNEEALVNLYNETTEDVYAAYAAYMLGALALEKGEIDAAEEWFTNAEQKNSPVPFIKRAVFEGKGVIAETKEDTETAAKYYKKAIAVKGSTFRVNDLRMKIALLKKNSGDLEAMKVECEQILSDTTATPAQKQNADNLLLSL